MLSIRHKIPPFITYGLIICAIAVGAFFIQPKKTQSDLPPLDIAAVPETLESARQMIKENKFEQAIHICTQLLKTDTNNTHTHLILGMALAATGKYEEAINHYVPIVNANPQNHLLHFQLGTVLHQAHRFEQARTSFEHALDLKPDYAEALLNLSQTCAQLGDMPAAKKHAEKCIELYPRNIHGPLNLGHIFNKEGNLEAAVEQYKKALTLDGNFANAHYNLGYTLKLQGNLPQAISALTKALELNKEYVDAHIARAQAYWAHKNYSAAFEDYEWRWHVYGLNRSVTETMWDGQPFKGKTILLFCEQGLGDTMQFMRYARMVKELGGTVICKVQEPLKKLLTLSCPYVTQFVSNNENKPPIHMQAALMSLPRIFKTTINTVPAHIPYLKADPNLVTYWRKQLAQDKNLKVGLCWHVDPKHEKVKSPLEKRSIPLADFAPLSTLEGITFYSLQKINGTDQLKNKPKKMNLHTFSKDFDESHGRFMDSAAVIENLDLVISVDTSIVHLAGGLGKPVLTILPPACDCRWHIEDSTTPWYPTMKLFRQKYVGYTEDVMKEIKAELVKYLSKSK